MVDVLSKQSCLTADQDKNIRLKKSHAFYTQIQCQLFVYGMHECDFVLCTKHDMLVDTIKRDEQFITNMVQKAEDFFDNVFLPEVVYPRVKYGQEPLDLRKL